MQNLLVLCSLFFSSMAFADTELKVISRDLGTKLTCKVIDVDDGYNQPALVKYTQCSGQQGVLELEKAKFEAVLKVEGLDAFSKEIIKNGMVQGDFTNNVFKFRIIGVVL